MKRTKHDYLSEILFRFAQKIHPHFGQLYKNHIKFFNDGFVELLCLIISNVFVSILSYSFIGPLLAIILVCIVTPITFGLKYILHKFWVWLPDES